MFKALVSVRLAALKFWFLGGGRDKAKPSVGKMIGFGLLMLYSLAALGFMFWHYFSVMYEAFCPPGLEWLYYSMIAIALFALSFLGTVFFAKAQLYEARDNELLLSMPIKPVHILASRIIMLLVIGVFFTLPVMVSAILVARKALFSSAYKLFAFLLVYVLMVLLALAAAAFFGWIFSVVTARVRKKALIGTVLCVALIAGYSWLIARLNTMLLELAAMAEQIAGRLGAVAPLYWIGSAIAMGNWRHLLLLCAVVLPLFALCLAMLILTFSRTASSKRGFARVKYVEKQVRAYSPEGALLRREFCRFTSSSAYMVNAGLGLFMMLGGAVLLIIKRKDIAALLSLIPNSEVLIIPIAAAALCLFASMNMISAPSVSLEGRNLWIVRSLPVSSANVLAAKVKLHLWVCLPVLALTIAGFSAALNFAAGDILLVAAPSVAFTVFIAVLGVVENLHFPNLNWTQEAQAVKSGFGVLFTMLISWGCLGAAAGVYLLWGDVLGFVPLCIAFTAGLIIATFFLCKWLFGKGCAVFESL